MSDTGQPPADPNQPGDPNAPPPGAEGAASATTPNQTDGGQSPPGGEGQGGEAGAAAAAQPASPPAADWRQARIDKLTGQLRETQRQLAAATAASTQTPPPVPGQSPPPPAAVDIERLANERAGQIAAQRMFDEACNAVAAEGAKANPDFQSRINSLRGLVNPQDPQEAAAYSALLSAAIDNGPAEAARILHHLGGDLSEAQRLLALSPTKMAVEITKLAMTAPEKLSGVAKPITPVAGGRQGPHTQVDPSDPERSDNLSTAEWMRRRNEQTTRKSA